MSDRTYDVCLYGATGFAGFLTAEYFNKQDGLKWAIAGRNEEKLKGVAEKLGNPDGLGIIVADSSNPESLVAMSSQTRVVCTTVGPYMKYGEPVVAACLETKTHYCDLTGEFPFMREMIDKYHDAAEQSGTKIVCAAGYDCIPVDYAAYLVARDMPGVTSMKALCTKMNGTMSGGTMASARGMGSWAKKPENKELKSDPYILAPEIKEENRKDTKWTNKKSFGWDSDFGTFSLPYFMTPTDNRVVRRSMFLRNGPYYDYDEAMSLGSIMRVLGFTMLHPFSVLGGLTPKPGEGPSKSVQRDGGFDMHMRGVDADGGVCSYVFKGKGDPGYAATAVMIGESALCLAFDQDKIPEGGGVITPTIAMGEVLLERLVATGSFSYKRTKMTAKI